MAAGGCGRHAARKAPGGQVRDFCVRPHVRHGLWMAALAAVIIGDWVFAGVCELARAAVRLSHRERERAVRAFGPAMPEADERLVQPRNPVTDFNTRRIDRLECRMDELFAIMNVARNDLGLAVPDDTKPLLRLIKGDAD